MLVESTNYCMPQHHIFNVLGFLLPCSPGSCLPAGKGQLLASEILVRIVSLDGGRAQLRTQIKALDACVRGTPEMSAIFDHEVMAAALQQLQTRWGTDWIWALPGGSLSCGLVLVCLVTRRWAAAATDQGDQRAGAGSGCCFGGSLSLLYFLQFCVLDNEATTAGKQPAAD